MPLYRIMEGARQLVVILAGKYVPKPNIAYDNYGVLRRMLVLLIRHDGIMLPLTDGAFRVYRI